MFKLMLCRFMAIAMMTTAKEGTITTNEVYDVMRADEFCYSNSMMLDDETRSTIDHDWIELWAIEHDKAGNAKRCFIQTIGSIGYEKEEMTFGTTVIEDEE